MKNNFIASKPDLKNPYLKNLIRFLDSFGRGDFLIQNLNQIVDKPKEESDKIIFHLLTLACRAQNIANINIGRYYLQGLPKKWLLKRINRLSKPILEPNDSWEYNRMLELYMTLDLKLAEELGLKALANDNIEIKEIGQDFFGK